MIGYGRRTGVRGPFGEDCDLRRHRLKIAARSGKNAKNLSVVAVALKLGVLLHRLWVKGEIYELLNNSAPMDEVLQTAAKAWKR